MKLSLLGGLFVLLPLLPACAPPGVPGAAEAAGRNASASSVRVCPAPPTDPPIYVPPADTMAAAASGDDGCGPDPDPVPPPSDPATCRESFVFNAYVETGTCEDAATRDGTWRATETFPGAGVKRLCTYVWDNQETKPDIGLLRDRVAALGARSNLYADCTCPDGACERPYLGKQYIETMTPGISVNCARCVKGYVHRGIIYVSLPPGYVTSAPSVLRSPEHGFAITSAGGQAAFSISLFPRRGFPGVVPEGLVSLVAEGDPPYDDFINDL